MKLMCYDRGILQAYLDGELSGSVIESVREHVAVCRACAEVLGELEQNAAFVDSRLGELAGAVVFDTDTAAAWNRFKEAKSRRRRRGIASVFGGRRLTAVAAAVALVMVFFAGMSSLDLFKIRKQAVEGPPGLTEQASPMKKAPGGAGGEKLPAGARSVARPPHEDGAGEAPRAMVAAPPAEMHAPLEIAAVREIRLRVPGEAPVSLTEAEKEQVVAWFNAGVPAGTAPEDQALESRPEGVSVVVCLTDGSEVVLLGADAGEVTVRRLQGVYRLHAPELAAYLKTKGGEVGEGIADR